MTGHNFRKLLQISIFRQPFFSTESIYHLPYCIHVKIIFSVIWLTDIEIAKQSRSRPDTVETGSILFLRGYRYKTKLKNYVVLLPGHCSYYFCSKQYQYLGKIFPVPYRNQQKVVNHCYRLNVNR